MLNVNQQGSVLVLLFPFASKEHAHAALNTTHKEKNKNKKQKNRRLNETLKRYVYLAQVLKSFYVEARKKDGSSYSMTVIAAIIRLSLFSSKQCIIKQLLLDSDFVKSGIIKVEVSVISRSRRLRLITLTSTLIIPDITKTSSNN